MSSTKSHIGHLLGAAGAVEALACLEAVRRGVLPPTINFEKPDPECDLDYVARGRRARRRTWSSRFSNSFGFGGQNACLAVATRMSAVFDVAASATRRFHVARARLELLFDAGTFRPTRSAVGDGVWPAAAASTAAPSAPGRRTAR